MSEKTRVKRRKINWTADKVMSSSAIIIAVISLIALFYQLSLAREENELIRKQQSASVLPYLHQSTSNFNKQFSFHFTNKGVGPAFIKKVEFILNDSIVFNNSDDFIRHVIKKVPKLNGIPYSVSTLTEGIIITANETHNIVVFFDYDARTPFLNYLLVNKMEYTIIYEDIYKTQWIYSKKTGHKTTSPILLESKN